MHISCGVSVTPLAWFSTIKISIALEVVCILLYTGYTVPNQNDQGIPFHCSTLLVLAKIVFADFSTHSLTTCDDGIFYWFDPNTGEICDPLDCGGGRAPPKTNVLACASYPGTYVTTISYLSCWTPPASATSTPVAVTSAESTTDTVATGKSTPTSPTTTSTATQVATGSSIMPSTTFPPSQSPNSKTHGNGTSSISGTVALSSSTNNKRHMLDGSLIAVAGAAIGAVALI